MKIIIYSSIAIILSFLVFINISCFFKYRHLKVMHEDYSFIINTKINYAFATSTQKVPQFTQNYILSIISPTCEDCYVKINKWKRIIEKNDFLKNRVVFVVLGDEFERLDKIVKESRDMNFFFDYNNEFFKLNPQILLSQSYVIDKDTIVLCGEPLKDKMVMNIFMDYIDR